MVVDALSRLSMGSVSHVEKDKELVHDVHIFARLGVCLVDSNVGSVVGKNSSKSSFVSYVKAKKILDLILIMFKQAVLKKFVKSFSQEGYDVLRY